jgi:hypothetical protein
MLFSLLLLSTRVFAAAGAAQPVEVGRVVQVAPEVTSGIAGQENRKSYRPLVKKAKVMLGTEVVTGKRAGARIRVGTEGGPTGTVDVGPRSEFLFEEWIPQAVGGKASLAVQIGFLFAYFQPRTGDQSQLITITTPSGVLYVKGTVVGLEVAPDGSTSVFVLEGTVSVVSKAGGEVTVAAGNQTRVAMGQAPTPPAPFSPSPGGPAPGLANRSWILDPPLVDLDDPRLDLPK